MEQVVDAKEATATKLGKNEDMDGMAGTTVTPVAITAGASRSTAVTTAPFEENTGVDAMTKQPLRPLQLPPEPHGARLARLPPSPLAPTDR